MASMFEQTVLPLFEEAQPDWLATARHVAFILGADGSEVTIDDVRTRVPPPKHIDPRIMGAVMLSKDWIKVGYRNSTRTTSHKRPVAVFKLRRAA